MNQDLQRYGDLHVPLSNFDILNFTDGVQGLRGVFMRDTLPKTKPWCVEYGILNLDEQKNEGTHWTLWYKNDHMKYYFDSFGMDPIREIQTYLGQPIICSTFRIQETDTKYCGHLCLYLLDKLIKGASFENAVIDLAVSCLK